MKKILKFTIRNVVRLPLRTLLCFFIAFITSVVVTVCFFISDDLRALLETLEEQYPAVATVSRQNVITPDGTKMPSGQFLTLDEVTKLGKSKSVEAYNITIIAGKLAQEEIIKDLPDELFLKNPPKDRIDPNAPESVHAVNNLMLTEAFFCGDSKIVSGNLFSEKDMRGGTRAIIISQSTADRYMLSVGEDITFNFENSDSFALYHIVGIYESQRGMTNAYIPLSDYFRDASIFLQGRSFLDSQTQRLDRVVRLDFLLKSPSLGETFIRDALHNEFDSANFDISINDKPYLILSSGLENIITLSEVLWISILVVGIGVLLLFILFFSLSRKREAIILNALGMKFSHIKAMFISEFACIMIVAIILGVLLATPFSRVAVSWLERGLLYEKIQEANQIEETDKSTIELTLQKNIHLSFSELDIGLKEYVFPSSTHLEEGQQGFREEIFWSNERILHLAGRTHLLAEGFENVASYDEGICAETHRMAGYVFSCYTATGGNYSVGDLIPISPQKTGESVILGTEHNQIVIQNREATAYLKVIGTYEATEHNDESQLTLPMKELELLCEYLGVSGKGIENIRYDLITREEQ